MNRGRGEDEEDKRGQIQGATRRLGLDGEHTVDYTDAVLQSCPPEIYIML